MKYINSIVLLSVLWHCWLGVRKSIRPVKKTEWWGAGVDICLERGADLHMAQLMPLPLTISCFSKTQTGFTFLVPAHLGSPGQTAIKRLCVINPVVYHNITIILQPLYRSTCVSRHLRLRTWGFCWCKVLLPHALADGNQRIWIREKTLEVSSTVLSTLSLYLKSYCICVILI